MPAPDLAPDPLASLDLRVLAVWNPVFFERPDGSREPVRTIIPELRLDPATRRLLGGCFVLTMADGATRVLEAEARSDTGFHLGTGLCAGLDGHHHGSWRGDAARRG